MSAFGHPKKLPPPHPPLHGGAAGTPQQPPAGPPVWRGRPPAAPVPAPNLASVPARPVVPPSPPSPPAQPPRPPARPPAPGGTPSSPPPSGRGGPRLGVVQGRRPKLTITELTPVLNRIAVHRGTRALWFRCITAASALACLIFMLVKLLMPVGEQVVVQILPPPSMVTVIPEPEVVLPPAEMAEELVALDKVDVTKDVAPPVEEPEPLPGERYRPAPPLPPDAGKAGRARAKEATSKLAAATASLDKTLSGLSSSLRTPSGDARPLPRGRRPRSTGTGRGGGDVAAVETGPVGTGASADLGSSSVEGAKLAIGRLTAGGATGGASGADGATTSSGAGPGVYRTNASLLAVIQKYAAGIQWCYENELKKDPTLRGKMVVAITVSAAGKVTGAAIIENTVESSRLSSCALSQVRDWRFPPVPEGSTAFQAPFVFTPPN